MASDLAVEIHGGLDPIHALLVENFRTWKRVDGDQFPEANEDFYDNILPNNRLDELSSKLLPIGHRFPHWGESYQGKKGLYYFGTSSQGKPVNVGIRFGKSHDDYRVGGEKRVREKTPEGKSVFQYKPQIVVTIRPLSVYMDITKDDLYLIGSGNGRRPDPKKVVNHPQWEKAQFRPLRVYLPVVPVGHNGSVSEYDFRNSVETIPDSRYSDFQSFEDACDGEMLRYFEETGQHLARSWDGGTW